MKHLVLSAALFLFVMFCSYGQANQSLSNLSSPTAVNVDLLPDLSSQRSLGSAAAPWNSLFLKGELVMPQWARLRLEGANLEMNSGTFNINGARIVSNNAYVELNGTDFRVRGGRFFVNYGQIVGDGGDNFCFNSSAIYPAGQGNTAMGANTISLNTGSFNTAMGSMVLRANTTGSHNTAIGSNSLYSNSTGSYNTAQGFSSLFKNTTGANNTANGANALYSNSTGSYNTAQGYLSLYNNTTGTNNTANGAAALYNNNTGSNNSAFGLGALYSNTTGGYNTGNGYYALYKNTNGSNNTASGSAALNANTTGSNNTAQGASALFNNITGTNNTANGSAALNANTTGSNNTAQGASALFNNITGTNNTANGNAALNSNTTGGANTAEGAKALLNNISGSYNTANGYLALGSNISGNLNTAIGFRAGDNTPNSVNGTFLGAFAAGVPDLFNATAIGNEAIAMASNQITLGNAAVNSIRSGGNYVIYSDGRFKKDIKEDVPGLDFINKLRPVTYHYKVHDLNKHIIPDNSATNQQAENKDSVKIFQEVKQKEEQAMVEKEKKLYTGFIAQEVEQLADRLHYDFSGVYKPANDRDVYGLSYSDFVVPLVKAVQELSKKTEEQQQKIDQLQEMVNKLSGGQSQLPQGSTGNMLVNLSGAFLEQNAPNPFIANTVIRYHLTASASAPRLVITNVKGQTLQTIQLNNVRDGQVTLSAGTLSAGSYVYSLWVDNRLADSKQMLIQR